MSDRFFRIGRTPARRTKVNLFVLEMDSHDKAAGAGIAAGYRPTPYYHSCIYRGS
jgi:hypothetical protein